MPSAGKQNINLIIVWNCIDMMLCLDLYVVIFLVKEARNLFLFSLLCFFKKSYAFLKCAPGQAPVLHVEEVKYCFIRMLFIVLRSKNFVFDLLFWIKSFIKN